MRKWLIKAILLILAMESILAAGIIYGQGSSTEGLYLFTAIPTTQFIVFSLAIILSFFFSGIYILLFFNEKAVDRLNSIYR